jgi:hypothetical protein
MTCPGVESRLKAISQLSLDGFGHWGDEHEQLPVWRQADGKPRLTDKGLL